MSALAAPGRGAVLLATRLGIALGQIAIVAVAVFALTALLPGDTAVVLLGEQADRVDARATGKGALGRRRLCLLLLLLLLLRRRLASSRWSRSSSARHRRS